VDITVRKGARASNIMLHQLLLTFPVGEIVGMSDGALLEDGAKLIVGALVNLACRYRAIVSFTSLCLLAQSLISFPMIFPFHFNTGLEK
jgi:hypothetical protein